MLIIGKWKTIWNSRDGSLSPETLSCEYTASTFIQEVGGFPDGKIRNAVVKCEYLGEGKLRHLIKGREGLEPVDYTYEIGDDGILTITNRHGTWKLERVEAPGNRLDPA